MSLCSVLKSLEFAGSVRDESSTSADESGKAKSLETLLLEKNRALQTENTQLKVSGSELNGKLLHSGGLADRQKRKRMTDRQIAYVIRIVLLTASLCRFP